MTYRAPAERPAAPASSPASLCRRHLDERVAFKPPLRMVLDGERLRFTATGACDRCGEPAFALVYRGLRPRVVRLCDALDRASAWLDGLLGR